MNRELKDIVNTMYKVCDSLDDSYDLDGLSMRELMRMDLLKFILYLGSADEEITEEEAEFIAEYLDWEMTIPQWCEFINNQNLHSDSILENVPLALQIFVDADNKAYSYDKSIMNACENYIWLFETLGDYFIESDNNVDRNEQIALGKYIAMLKHYYDENSLRVNGDISITDDKVDKEKLEVLQEDTDGIHVRFLDKNYIIPEDALTFMQCREFVSNGLIKLLDESSKLMKKYARIGSEKAFASLSEDTPHLQRVMMSIVKDVHNDLLSREIYDVDEYELYERVPSIKQVETMATEVSLNMLSAAMEVREQNQAMRDYAYRSAANNITGSGVRIFTSSFTSLMVHSAIENSILKSQAKKADQEYEQALKRISASSGDQFTRIQTEGIFNQFLPALPEIFTTFHDELLKNYLLELAQHNQFNIDNIERYSENKSSTMLENINHAGDKKKLLIQAFEECPFNIEVYEKMIELGFFDVETMKDAKKIFKVSELSGLLEEKIKNNLKKPDVIKDYITVLADYKGKNETEILKTFYQSTISRIKTDYHELFLLCTDSKRLGNWIKDKINSDMDKVVTISEEDARNKVNSWIQMTVEDSEFAELSNMGLMTIEDIQMKDSTMATLEDVKSEYSNIIVSRIMEYIKEAKVKKVAYEEAYDKFNAELKKKSDALDSKMAELKQQGMFAFSKKKEIKAEIEQLQRELEDFRKTEPVKLREAYYGMYA